MDDRYIGSNPGSNPPIRSYGLITANTTTTVTAALNINTWYYLVGTYNGFSGNLRLYVNGSLEGETTTPILPLYKTRTYYVSSIGSYNQGVKEWFNGLIDEVGIYNRALSVGEIQAIYNAGSAGKCKPSRTIVGSVDTPGDARSVHVYGPYAYVADGYSGLQIVDVSDPSNPFIVRPVNIAGDALSVYVSHPYAYVANWYGLVVIDISDPWHPTIVDSVDTPGGSRDVYVSGDYAYVTDGDLQVIRVSD